MMRPRECVRNIDLMAYLINDGLLSYEPGTASRSSQDLPIRRSVHSGTAKSSVSLPKPPYSPQQKHPWTTWTWDRDRSYSNLVRKLELENTAGVPARF